MYFDEKNNYFDYIDKDYFKYENNNLNSIDKYNEINFDKININVNNYRNNNLYSSLEGFNNGNMFKDLYKPYKNYKYKVVVNGKREALLLKIEEFTFACKDLNLYLDIHPDDENILNIYKKYAKELEKYKNEYENNYGPLCALNVTKDYFNWIKNPWPWENKGGNINV